MYLIIIKLIPMYRLAWCSSNKVVNLPLKRIFLVV